MEENGPGGPQMKVSQLHSRYWYENDQGINEAVVVMKNLLRVELEVTPAPSEWPEQVVVTVCVRYAENPSILVTGKQSAAEVHSSLAGGSTIYLELILHTLSSKHDGAAFVADLEVQHGTHGPKLTARTPPFKVVSKHAQAERAAGVYKADSEGGANSKASRSVPGGTASRDTSQALLESLNRLHSAMQAVRSDLKAAGVSGEGLLLESALKTNRKRRRGGLDDGSDGDGSEDDGFHSASVTPQQSAPPPNLQSTPPPPPPPPPPLQQSALPQSLYDVFISGNEAPTDLFEHEKAVHVFRQALLQLLSVQPFLDVECKEIQELMFNVNSHPDFPALMDFLLRHHIRYDIDTI